MLVQQQGFQGADALVQVIDADEIRFGGGQVQPEVPVAAQPGNACGCLRGGKQCIVIADIDAFHAALAGIRVDGDGEQAAAVFRLFLTVQVIGFGNGKLEFAKGLHEPAEFLFQARLAVAFQFGFGQCGQHRLVHEQMHLGRFAGRVNQGVQAFLDLAGGPAQVLRGLPVAFNARHDGGEDVADAVHQPGNGAVRADAVAVATGGAVFADPLWIFKADLGHVPEHTRGGRYQAEADIGVCQVFLSPARQVEAAGLFPESMYIGNTAIGLG